MLNSFKPNNLQPLKFSLVSPSSRDPSVPECARNLANIVGIKNELVQFVDLDRNESSIYHNSACSNVDQNCVDAALDVPVSSDKTSQCVGFRELSSETPCSLYTDVPSERSHTANSQSTDVRNRLRRQLIKPQRFIRDYGMTKSTSIKISTRKSKKSEIIQQRGRGRAKDQNVKQKRITTKASTKTAKAARERRTKPDQRSTSAKVSPVTRVETENGAKIHEGNCLFSCSLCSFKSKWSKEYYGHMKLRHFPGPPFYCDNEQCEYSTDKFQQLVSHRRQHSDQRPFVCDICLMAFRNMSNLYQHLKIHSDEKKFECPECGHSFRLKNTLVQHMVIHSNLRPYLCDLCGFCTKFQSHLISHKRIHTGDVYHCDFQSCTYSTPKKSQMKSHMRSHLDIRGHVCGSCGKAFIEKSHLIRHERTHSSERAHVCKNCSYSSTRADKLREHVQKHHSAEAVRAKTVPSVLSN
ncbi:unnamed protein product [Candidula unifasciata]|uniref:C2H2-type domain-containing protein n=1 Tax=Candidula unifasciata TaxID=100452 RepID=A0A8S3ZX23_9EUPU|nr:unnamed protein product [Candidula unifasciata]